MIRNFTDVSSKNELEKLGRLYPIKLESYNPEWKQEYIKEEKFLIEMFGDMVFRINHIGSTSVQGLTAKPIIDILLELNFNADLSLITEIMKDNGYQINKPSMDLIMFLKGYGPKGYNGQTFHIHVRYKGDYNELYFRDYLVSHKKTADEYGKLKLNLQKKFEFDRDSYTEAKGDFISEITMLARNEFKDRYTK